MTSDIATRTLSALVLGVVVLFITWWHPVSFATMCILAGVILGREWWVLTKHRSWLFVPLGIVYIGLAVFSLIYLRRVPSPDPTAGSCVIFLLFGLVWTGDISAYLVGRRFGKHKIWPRISPGKSWEGLAASIVASIAFITGIILYYYGPNAIHAALYFGVLLGPIFAILGLLGDLFESALKRHAGVKDSGTLIPGHGGLFDRLDALMPCAIIVALAIFAVNIVLR